MRFIAHFCPGRVTKRKRVHLYQSVKSSKGLFTKLIHRGRDGIRSFSCCIFFITLCASPSCGPLHHVSPPGISSKYLQIWQRPASPRDYSTRSQAIVVQDMTDQKYKLLCPFVRMAISYGFAPWSHKEVSPSHAKRLACLNPNLMRSTLGPTNLGPTNVQEPWCLSNAASTTMITMSTTMICSKRAVPSKLNSLKCKFFYFHTNCILEF